MFARMTIIGALLGGSACQPTPAPAPPRAALVIASAPPPNAAPATPDPGPTLATDPEPVVEVGAPARRGTCDEALDTVGAQRWTGRAVTTGIMPGPSHLTTRILQRNQDVATLVVQEHHTTTKDRGQDDQPHGGWACVSSTTYQGTVSGGKRMTLRLTSDGGETSELVCTKRSVRVAGAQARRIRVPSTEEGCNASRWQPAKRRTLEVLACVSASDPEGTPFFVAAAGVEHVTYDNDDCGDPTTALRAVAKDGAIAPAMRISEQPDEYIPADLRRPK